VVRRKKLSAVRERGIDPYPNDFRPDHTTAEVHARFGTLGEADLGAAPAVSIAGRIMALRDFGKAAFLHLQDRAGRLQVHARRDRLGDERFELYLARELKHVGHARDEGEFLDVVPLAISEALAWIQSGRITDIKAVSGLLWLKGLAV